MSHEQTAPAKKTFPLLKRGAAFLLKCLLVVAGLMLIKHNPLWVDETGALETVRSAGFTPVRVGGYRWLGCRQWQPFHTGFIARTASDKPVSGVVCRNLKGEPEMRYDRVVVSSY
jgi:hypothetical protein